MDTALVRQVTGDRPPPPPPCDVDTSVSHWTTLQTEDVDQCWFYVGPTSTTLAQHKINIGSARCLPVDHCRPLLAQPDSLAWRPIQITRQPPDPSSPVPHPIIYDDPDQKEEIEFNSFFSNFLGNPSTLLRCNPPIPHAGWQASRPQYGMIQGRRGGGD